MNKNRIFLLVLILITLESIIPILTLDWKPSEPQSALLFGYSVQRLMAIGCTIFLCANLFFLTFKAIISPAWRTRTVYRIEHELLEKQHLLEVFLSAAFLFVLGSSLLLLLNLRIDERFGMLLLVYQRFQGLSVWIVALFGQTLVFLYLVYRSSFRQPHFFPSTQMIAILSASVGKHVSNTLKALILASIVINWLGVLWWFGLYCG